MDLAVGSPSTLVFVAFVTLRLLDLLLGDLRRLAICRACSRLGASGSAVRSCIAGRKSHIDSLVNLLLFARLVPVHGKAPPCLRDIALPVQPRPKSCRTAGLA